MGVAVPLINRCITIFIEVYGGYFHETYEVKFTASNRETMVTLTKEVTDRLAEAFQKGRQLPVHLTSRCLRTGLAENDHVELGHHTAGYIYI